MAEPQNLAEIYAKQKWWDDRRSRAEKRMIAASATRDQCYQHLGVYSMVQQIRTLLQPHFPNQTLAVLGPFGLGHTTSIHAYPIGLSDRQQRGNLGSHCLGSLTFRPIGDHRLALVDYNRDNGLYKPGSLGAYSGLNYAEDEVPEIPVLADMLWKQIKEAVA